MRPPLRILSALIAGALLPAGANAHDSFLLWHSHHLHLHGHAETGHDHDHAHEHHGHDHAHAEGKESFKLEVEPGQEQRWAIGTGVRYTRLSWEGEPAHLWESGLGISYHATPWLHLGAEMGYGWFDSEEGGSEGWTIPHAFAEVHVPLSESWELAISAEVGAPGGDEGLVGNHWELSPSMILRYDRGKWFAEAGASFVFILGGDSHLHGSAGEDNHDSTHEEEEEEHEHEHEGGAVDHEEHDEHEAEESHEHESGGHGHSPGDYHEVVDPHGERELRYHAAIGVRLLDERLTLEGRFHGVHVTSGDVVDRDFLRVGLRASYQLAENWAIRTETNIPISDARRYQWQTSVSLQVSF